MDSDFSSNQAPPKRRLRASEDSGSDSVIAEITELLESDRAIRLERFESMERDVKAFKFQLRGVGAQLRKFELLEKTLIRLCDELQSLKEESELAQKQAEGINGLTSL